MWGKKECPEMGREIDKQLGRGKDMSKKKILYVVEAMGGGVFTYIVDLANELVNEFDMYIAYALRPQTPSNYKEYFDKRIHLIGLPFFPPYLICTISNHFH